MGQIDDYIEKMGNYLDLTGFSLEQLYELEGIITYYINEQKFSDCNDYINLLVDVRDDIYIRTKPMDDTKGCEEILMNRDIMEKELIKRLLINGDLDTIVRNKHEIRLNELRQSRAVKYGLIEE